VVSDAVASGSVQALNYFVAQKYVAALQEFATSPNQKILMMPIEASALIGTLGGIAEIAREGFGGGGGEGGATGGDGSAKPRRPGGPRGGATSTPAASAAPRGSVPGIDPWKA
jgi:hypothetical protein